jgi:hypothetical protein
MATKTDKVEKDIHEIPIKPEEVIVKAGIGLLTKGLRGKTSFLAVGAWLAGMLTNYGMVATDTVPIPQQKVVVEAAAPPVHGTIKDMLYEDRWYIVLESPDKVTYKIRVNEGTFERFGIGMYYVDQKQDFPDPVYDPESTEVPVVNPAAKKVKIQ